jgi:hypothetical protein
MSVAAIQSKFAARHFAFLGMSSASAGGLSMIYFTASCAPSTKLAATTTQMNTGILRQRQYQNERG